ncbi:hypothetical protein TTHERM_000572149 (macronuclear) [Tetrahymena thermophila SB210]|uniref:Uncharacterized protein n=1 Tax=Tetrahymena thermophila (strain SB210) TaxID=312017 RepID=W7XEA5_TETTS|nr:hypothetical protein TTHERM_000572149 [Tetrahymena thermophila SB210]EWS72271.1 hypothetical protein TTHERM_000572149 [Tetrahymena thermophila SB210]|eukprot:XP_012655211.1 hypothetical protein TTHERM_000572149 [Tetrahymena thermophila SB210]
MNCQDQFNLTCLIYPSQAKRVTAKRILFQINFCKKVFLISIPELKRTINEIGMQNKIFKNVGNQLLQAHNLTPQTIYVPKQNKNDLRYH